MFAETRSLAEDYAYRWLAACAHGEHVAHEAPVAAVHEAPSPYPGPQVLDALHRRQLALQEAVQGVVWTTAAFATRCGVRPVTAWKDLKALVDQGFLVADGGRRTRRYRAATQVSCPDPEAEGPAP